MLDTSQTIVSALMLFAVASCSTSHNTSGGFSDDGGGGAADAGSYPCCAMMKTTLAPPYPSDGSMVTLSVVVPCLPDSDAQWNVSSNTGTAICHPDGCIAGGMAGTLASCPICSGVYSQHVPPNNKPLAGTQGCDMVDTVDQSSHVTGTVLSLVTHDDQGTSVLTTTCVCATGTQCADTTDVDAAAVECL